MKKLIDTLYMKKLIKKYSDLLVVLILIFAISYILIGSFEEITSLPKGSHQWKQSMHFSMVENFSLYSVHFMYPAIDNLFNHDNTGHLIQEFPILNYIASFFFPQFPYMLKIINILCFFLGLLIVYKFSMLKTGNHIISVGVSVNVLLIPIVFFYGFSYLTDVSALFFGFISVYLLEIYRQFNRSYLFFLSILLFTLSGLIRLPVIIFPVSYYIMRILYDFKYKYLIAFFISLSIIILWHVYIIKYNHYYISSPKELCYLCINQNTKQSVIHSINKHIKYQLGYSNALLFYYIIAYGLIYIYRNKFDKEFLTLLFLVSVLTFLYLFLWFGIFDVHDYYLTPIVPLFILLWIGLFKILYEINIKVLYLALGLLVISNFLYSIDNIRWRFYQNRIKNPYKIISEFEEGNLWWQENEDKTKWSIIRKISPFNRSNILKQNGILKGDTAICTFDESPTYVLSLLCLKGWSKYNTEWKELNQFIEKVKLGAKYLITYKKTPLLENNKHDSILKLNLVLQADSIYIYNIQHLKNFIPNN